LLHQKPRLVMRRDECLEHTFTVYVRRRHDFFLGLDFPFWRRLEHSNKPASKPSRSDCVFPRPLRRGEFSRRFAERRRVQSVGLRDQVRVALPAGRREDSGKKYCLQTCGVNPAYFRTDFSSQEKPLIIRAPPSPPPWRLSRRSLREG